MSMLLPIINSPRTMDIVFLVWFCTQCVAVTILDSCVAQLRLVVYQFAATNVPSQPPSPMPSLLKTPIQGYLPF